MLVNDDQAVLEVGVSGDDFEVDPEPLSRTCCDEQCVVSVDQQIAAAL